METRCLGGHRRAYRHLGRTTHRRAGIVEEHTSVDGALRGGGGRQNIMEDAIESMAGFLEVEYSKILELLPGDEELLLRAGCKEGLDHRAPAS
jgi:hypothetical protein